MNEFILKIYNKMCVCLKMTFFYFIWQNLYVNVSCLF